MEQYKIDIPVLLIFFTRHVQFSKVFEEIRIAKPSKLYLYQDGPRDNRPDDIEGIRICRDIAENIDWNCEVHKYYQEKNMGCDPSEFIAQKWMFETEEVGIILEDDDVPSQSFFHFCKELLEKYKYDERIHMICGMNNTVVSKHIESSYLFTKKGSIWGWASWKRVIDLWDENYTWLDDPNKINKLKNAFDNKNEYKKFISTAKKHKVSSRAHYESINAASLFFHNQLNIVPQYNMITNIGIAEETTHSVSDIRLLPRRIRRLLFMKRYEIEFPLKHPEYIIQDKKFEKEMTITQIQSYINKVEGTLLKIRYRDLNGIKKAFKRIFWNQMRNKGKVIK
ncbi:hypothetical protein [Paenibacillus sp. BAC0078]